MKIAAVTALTGALIAFACATLAAEPGAGPQPDEALIAPPPALHLENVPPIAQSLVRRIGPYTEFRGKPVVAWHPRERAMIVAFRTGNTTQLHRLAAPLGSLAPLTDGPDPVRHGVYEPRRGSYLLFARDSGGNEAAQIYRMDLPGRAQTLLTDPREKHALGPWNHAGDAILLLSTQLDKTAAGGRRQAVTIDLWRMDPLKPAEKRKIASLPGGGWYAFDWSPDDRRLVATNYVSARQSEVWLLDVESGERTRLLPRAGDTARASYDDVHWSRDGKALFLTSDRDGEFKRLARLALASGHLTPLTSDIAWDIDSVAMDRGRTRLAVTVNEDGRSTLRLFDPETLKPLPLPALPPGSVGNLRWTEDGALLAFTLDGARAPYETWTLEPSTDRLTQWTAADTAGMDTSGFRPSEIVRWKSFDGRVISGLMTRPPARFTGPRPVVISIHGGPEAQATEGFLGRYNYPINELGVVLIEPNVRGSRGYGKSFLSLDDGMKREDAVKDIGALLDWIRTQPGLDAGRVLVEGGSYGGYMSLAVASRHADRIRGAVDIVGISNFVSFLERTESYRRDLRRAEYGDERDPAMRAFLDRISPLGNAHRIVKPLFVVQGRNDPRVPVQEAEQIVAEAREQGTSVWVMIADDEGHGFARKNNADYLFYARMRFIEETLLK